MKKEEVKVINCEKVLELSKTIADRTDPNGSYTGVPINKGEMPVQDADDL